MKRKAAIVVALLAAGAALLLRPLSPSGLDSHPHPAKDYAEALRLLEALRAGDTPEISPECRTELLTRGARAPRVVVLFHGLTNCPAQFDSIGRLCFARGANVLIPRLPRHGRADRMTDDLARLDARELREFTDRAIDVAEGLGDTVIVAGLSVGGVLAAWAAEDRGGVDRAVVIAPLLGATAVPARLHAAAIRLACLLPNAFVWWDDQRRENLLGPRHVYPRFSTRSAAATMLLGAALTMRAGRVAPACRSLAVVTVGGDAAVDNRATAALVHSWRTHGAAVEAFEFPAALHLSHDVVDPEQVGGNPPVTYPVLMRLIGL